MRNLLAFALLLPAAASAQSGAPFLVEQTGARYASLQQAVDSAGGDLTVVVAPGRYRDCAVVAVPRFTLRAAEPGTASFDGGACEGKGTLVLKGAAALIDGLVFENVRVADRNGAGIRLERGDLHVRETMFRNSEQGILTASDPGGRILIEWSTFSGLGGCPDGMCSHSIYVGDYGALTVRNSRFEAGTGGHYLKSRAPLIEVTDSSFDDSRGRDTNYMIDMPHGARGTIAGNRFVQGRGKENHSAFVIIAGEGAKQPTDLRLSRNQAAFAPGVSWPSAFVATLDRAAKVRIDPDNRLDDRLERYQVR